MEYEVAEIAKCLICGRSAISGQLRGAAPKATTLVGHMEVRAWTGSRRGVHIHQCGVC